MENQKVEEKELVQKVDAVDGVEVKKDSKFKNGLRRVKAFLKTRKGKVVFGVTVLFVLVLGGVSTYLIINSSKQVAIQVAKNLASDKVYDNFDFIYNSGDNKLVASTVDNLKQLELVSGSSKILDYIVSPDKKKIAYSVSDPDYKSKIKSPNADLTKFNFDPVAFKIYELNLETGENKLIWSIDSIQLGATQQQLYKKKVIVYPDSYVEGVDWLGNPFSYPVSYVQEVDDIEAGYQTTYLPYDLRIELSEKSTNLISYSPDGNSILLSAGNKVMQYDLTLNTHKEYSADIYQDCYFDSGKWEFSYINLEYSCIYGGAGGPGWGYGLYGSSNKVFTIDGDTLKPAFKYDIFSGGGYIAVNPQYALVQSNQTLGGTYGYDLVKSDLSIYDFATTTIKKVGELGAFEQVRDLEVLGSNDTYFISIKTADGKAPNYGNNSDTKWMYTIYRYDPAGFKLDTVTTIELPSDISGLSYDVSKNIISYFRRYQASTETIIEYKVLNLTEPRKETGLLTLKVDNDSVLYYKPRLVWFNHQ